MGWWDRVTRRAAAPAPFDCLWCASPPRGEGRHDMCTGSALRPHREGAMAPAASAPCACAQRDHAPPRRRRAPEPTEFPTLPDGWAERRRLPQEKRTREGS